jgi:hypothetical protein
LINGQCATTVWPESTTFGSNRCANCPILDEPILQEHIDSLSNPVDHQLTSGWLEDVPVDLREDPAPITR